MEKFTNAEYITRRGIVVKPSDVPFDCSLIFNAGISKCNGKYVMLLRNDYGITPQVFVDFYAGLGDRTNPKTNLVFATSDDGFNFKIDPEPRLELRDDYIRRVYDPRLTDLGNGEYGLCFAMDTQRHGILGGIAVTRDFRNFDIKSTSVPENRNMVLFPEKINGNYVRLERPFRQNLGASSIWISQSPDLKFWGESKPVLSSFEVEYAGHKIGPGAPPVKTSAGWLTIFHAVKEIDYDLPSWHRNWRRIYYAGAMLLDLKDPSKVIAVAQKPLLVPEADYELEGYRGSAIFPGGLIKEDDDSLKVYYGAADICECMAETTVNKMLDFIDKYRK